MGFIKKLLHKSHEPYPETPEGWYNLGAEEYNRQNYKQAALRFFAGYEAAHSDPELRGICAFAYALSRHRLGEALSYELLPVEEREDIGAATCAFYAQNIANRFRRDGFQAQVALIHSSRTITAEIHGSRYILRVMRLLDKVFGSGGRVITVGRIKRQKELNLWDGNFERTVDDDYVISIFEAGIKAALPIAPMSVQ